MIGRSYDDVIGGAALVLIGSFATVYALATLPIGTVTNMGAGMFPAALGILLVGFGILILLSGLAREGELPTIHPRSLLVVLSSILAFAIVVRPFGMVPAIVVLTLIACSADGRLSIVRTIALSASLAVVATLIFKIGLGLPVSIISWPW